MKRNLNQLFFAVALMCGAMTVTSCQGLIDAVLGHEDTPVQPTSTLSAEELAEKQLIAELVEMVNEAQEEGSVTTLNLTLDGVEYPFTFKMVNGQFVLQTATAAGTRGEEDNSLASVDGVLAKYDIEVKALSRNESEKINNEEEGEEYWKDSEIAEEDPAIQPTDDEQNLWNNGTVNYETEYLGDWTEEEKDQISSDKSTDDEEEGNALGSIGVPENYASLQWTDDDEAKLNDIFDSYSNSEADDVPVDVKLDDPILDVTVKEKTTGNTVLHTQYDVTTLSMAQTGVYGYSSDPTVIVNEKKKAVSTKTPTCSITYPKGSVKKMYFNSKNYQNWDQLIKKFTLFKKKGNYINYSNFWLCKTDGTLVTGDSKIEPSYIFRSKVSKIKVEIEGGNKMKRCVGDKVRVKVVALPKDALVTGVFEVTGKIEDFSIEKVPGTENVFELIFFQYQKRKISFRYVDYGKKFKKSIMIKISSSDRVYVDLSTLTEATTLENHSFLRGTTTYPITIPDGYTVTLSDATINYSGDDAAVSLEGSATIFLADGTENIITENKNGSGIHYVGDKDNQKLTIDSDGGGDNKGKLTVSGFNGISVNNMVVSDCVLDVKGTGSTGILIMKQSLEVMGGIVTVYGNVYPIMAETITLGEGLKLYEGDSADNLSVASDQTKVSAGKKYVSIK